METLLVSLFCDSFLLVPALWQIAGCGDVREDSAAEVLGDHFESIRCSVQLSTKYNHHFGHSRTGDREDVYLSKEGLMLFHILLERLLDFQYLSVVAHAHRALLRQTINIIREEHSMMASAKRQTLSYSPRHLRWKECMQRKCTEGRSSGPVQAVHL